jgi:hypothetical protein
VERPREAGVRGQRRTVERLIRTLERRGDDRSVRA